MCPLPPGSPLGHTCTGHTGSPHIPSMPFHQLVQRENCSTRRATILLLLSVGFFMSRDSRNNETVWKPQSEEAQPPSRSLHCLSCPSRFAVDCSHKMWHHNCCLAAHRDRLSSSQDKTDATADLVIWRYWH